MNRFKIAIVAAAGLLGVAGGAAAMTPTPLLAGPQDVAAKVEAVRWVCGPYRCHRQPDYYGPRYFAPRPYYYGPPRPRRDWHRGYRWRRW